MGGYGSGNYRPSRKVTVEDCLSIDANRWTREGILVADCIHSGSWRWTYSDGSGFTVDYEADMLEMADPHVQLSYSWVWRSTGKQDSAAYRVNLTTTGPRFGGLRWWFVCPLVKGGRACRRRVGKLYLPPAGRYFGCRHCYDLTYTSCQESAKPCAGFRAMAAGLGYSPREIERALRERFGA